LRRVPDRRLLGLLDRRSESVLDRHPIEVDRDRYLKHALTLQLPHLDDWKNPFVTKLLSIVTFHPACF
jgi:hypothetical protein